MKKWKRTLSVLMAFGMALGLCACGGKKGTSADPSLAKQFVYRMNEYDLSILGTGDDIYVQSCMQKDGKIYLVAQIYNYSTDGETKRKLLTMDMDGGNQQVCELQEKMEGAEEQDGQDDDAAQAAKDDAADDGSDDGADGEPDEGGAYEYVGLNNFRLSDAGLLYGVKDHTYDDYSNPEEPVHIQNSYVCCWDMQGKMLWESLLEGLQEENSWSYVSGLVGRKDGGATVLISGDKSGKYVVDGNGGVSARQPINDKIQDMMERSSVWTVTPDGKMIFAYYNDNWTTMYFNTYDVNTDTLGTETELPSSMAMKGMDGLSIDEKGDVFFANSQGVFRYRIGGDEVTQMMSYVNSDLEISNLQYILPIDEEHFAGFYMNYDHERGHSAICGGSFTKVDPKDIPDKNVMVLAGNYISYDIRTRAIEFNKASDSHRIVLKDYSEFNTFEDYNAGMSQLNNDIISGNMPDILMIDNYGNMPVESYISKRLLADIGKLMEKDEEISQIEYMDNILDACRVNGKLYEIVPTFNVTTYAGKTSLLGERENGWTMEEAQAFMAGMPEGMALFGDMSRTNFVTILLQQCGSDFVDISSGKCNFNSKEFIDLLKFAATLPTEEELSKRREDEWEAWYNEYQSQYRENRTLLSYFYFSEGGNMVNIINGSFGEDVTYVGFPGMGGRGAVIQANTTYALSAKSANLDAAWDFMRYYLLDEYQAKQNWNIPLTKKYMIENMQKATQKPYYENENGEKEEYEYTYWMNNEEITLQPLTQAQVDKAIDFLCSVNKRAYYNQDIQKIITEETEAFFSGDKTAEEAAAIIQSRAQLFVNENR